MSADQCAPPPTPTHQNPCEIFVDEDPKGLLNSGFRFLLQVLVFLGCRREIFPALQRLQRAEVTPVGLDAGAA